MLRHHKSLDNIYGQLIKLCRFKNCKCSHKNININSTVGSIIYCIDICLVGCLLGGGGGGYF